MSADELKALPSRVAAYALTRIPALPSSSIVLAASGGGDSCAMVSLLCESGLVSTDRAVVAHFDHRLRSDEASTADRQVVDALARRYALRVVAGAWDRPQPSEAAAREARYAFLRAVAEDVAPERMQIVTGHTSDDQAETVLMHAMRGAGLNGLAGMDVLSPFPFDPPAPVRIARPLLGVTRAETRAWCAHRAIAFQDDETNQERRYLRNRVRHDLVPALARRGIGAKDLNRLADEARALASALDDVLAPFVRETHEGVAMSRDVIASLPLPARLHLARLAVTALLGDGRDIGRAHYERIAAAAARRTGAEVELPRGVRAIVDHDDVVVTLASRRTPAIDPAIELSLPFAGRVGVWVLDVRRTNSDGATALPHDAVIRRRRPGDRMRLRGGQRKLQDVLTDAGVPRRHRDTAPVIATGALVLWTPWVAGMQDEGEPHAVEARAAG